MIKSFAQRVAVLVDVQNMFYATRAVFNGKLNYEKLLKEIVGQRQLIRAIAFVVQRPDIDQRGFYEALERFGYEVQVREARNRTDEQGNVIPTKGSYEVMVAVQAMTLAERIDTLVLVTGEGNYTPLVECLTARGVRVEIVGVDRSTSQELIKCADDCTYINDKLIIKNRTEPSNTTSTEIDRGGLPEDEEDFEEDLEEAQPASNKSSYGLTRS